jgi:hypothetical protein
LYAALIPAPLFRTGRDNSTKGVPVALTLLRLATEWFHPFASFWPALLPAAAACWPAAQVFMLACQHQSAATLLSTAASFGLPRRYLCSLAGTNLLAATLLPAAASFWPPAQVFVLACRHQSASEMLSTAASF